MLYFFSDTFIRWLVLPLLRALEQNGLPPEIQVLTAPETLLAKLKLSLVFALVMLAPWILYQAWAFIRPGLHTYERRFVRLLVPGSVVLTILGATLLYFVMLPLMLQVLVKVGASLDLGQGSVRYDPRVRQAIDADAEPPLIVVHLPEQPLVGRTYLVWPEWKRYVAVTGDAGVVELLPAPALQSGAINQQFRLSTYINFVLLMLLGVVVGFQMPLVILLLGWLGLASADWLAAQRRYALFVCAILSAFLTPADVVSMIVMLVPLYGLYELGILLLRLVPAGHVAEGRVFAFWRSDKRVPGSVGPPDRPADKRPTAPDQPLEPAQPEGSVARMPPGKAPTSEPPSRPADDEGGSS